MKRQMLIDAYATVYLFGLGRFTSEEARSRLLDLGMPEHLIGNALECPSIRAVTVSLLFKLGELSESTAIRQLIRLGLTHQSASICLWTGNIKQLFSIAGEAVRVREGAMAADPTALPRRPGTARLPQPLSV